MVDDYPAEKIDHDQLHKRLSALYARSSQLREENAAQNSPRISRAAELDPNKVLRSRLNSVEDARSGVDYAVWVLGETLCAIGGTALMHLVAGRFEDEHGPRGAVWLDHRWSDVQARGDIWLA